MTAGCAALQIAHQEREGLSQISVLAVPAQGLGRRRREPWSRPGKLPPLHLIIMNAVVEVRFEPLGHGEAQVFGDSHEPSIEEPVDVRPEQKPVRDIVLAAGRVGADMGGIEDRQRLFTRYAQRRP